MKIKIILLILLITSLGFAQNLQQPLNTLGYENQDLLNTDDEGFMSLRYNDFIPHRLKLFKNSRS